MGTAWDDAERAALVALLRTRPDGLGWRQIAAEVDALALWNELHPHDLLSPKDSVASGTP